MTDDLTPDPPDQRDEHVAELLEVPPLDEVTRRRFVATALEAATPKAAAPSAGGRGRRFLAVAAASLAVVAIGAGVFAAVNDDGGSGSTIAGRQEPKREAEAGTGVAEDSTESAPPAAAPGALPDAAAAVPRELGELGDITDPDRLRAVVRGGLSGSAQQQRSLSRPEQMCVAGRAATETPVVAVGGGRFENDPVVILVTPKALGSYEITVVDAANCTVRTSLTL